MEHELFKLLEAWQFATGPARDIAFNNLVRFMAANPAFAQNMIKGGGVFLAAYEVHLLRLFAAGATARIAQSRALPLVQQYMSRLAFTLARAPKIPQPAVAGMIVAGAVLMTGCEMKAEEQQREDAKPSYNLYVTNFLLKSVQAATYHPQARFSSPPLFEEWYQENRT